MRRLVPLLIFVGVVCPNVLFSLGCILPGCGSSEAPDAPAEAGVRPVVDVPVTAVDAPPRTDTGTEADTSGAIPTGDTGPELADTCDDAPPSLLLASPSGQAFPDEVWLEYGGKVESCSGTLDEGGVHVALQAHGLRPGSAVVSWRVHVEDEKDASDLDGEFTVDLACADGVATARIALGLPESADGATVTLHVDATQDGTVVSDEVQFEAHVRQR